MFHRQLAILQLPCRSCQQSKQNTLKHLFNKMPSHTVQIVRKERGSVHLGPQTPSTTVDLLTSLPHPAAHCAVLFYPFAHSLYHASSRLRCSTCPTCLTTPPPSSTTSPTSSCTRRRPSRPSARPGRCRPRRAARAAAAATVAAESIR